MNSFNFFSDEGGGQGTYLAAAQVVKTGASGDGSAWVGVVPEPATGALLGLGLTSFAVYGRSRRRH